MPPGVLRSVVPAGPDAWITALRRYGTMGFGEVAESAIRFARDGFPAPRLLCDIVAANEEGFRRWPTNEAIFFAGGRPPKPGDDVPTTTAAPGSAPKPRCPGRAR